VKNPIGTDSGRAEMRQLSEKYNIAVVSLCADYFMARPLAEGRRGGTGRESQ